MADPDRVELYLKMFDTDEEKLKIILPGDGWTFEEARIAKGISDGMAPAEIEGAMWAGDPDAWLAVLRVSYLRAEREFPTHQIQNLDVMQLMKTLQNEAREAAKGLPPTHANGNSGAESSAPGTIASSEVSN